MGSDSDVIRDILEILRGLNGASFAETSDSDAFADLGDPARLKWAPRPIMKPVLSEWRGWKEPRLAPCWSKSKLSRKPFVFGALRPPQALSLAPACPTDISKLFAKK